MQEHEPLTHQQSLSIIEQMIEAAKKEQKDDGVGWIVWGWMLLTASILTVLNMRFDWFSPFFFWNVFGGLTVIYAIYETLSTAFFKKHERVKTYTRALFDKLNAGFFISLLFIIVGINVGIGPALGFPLLISLYAFWILIYGAALSFRPSVIAAYVTWGIGFAAFFVKTFEQVMLLHALSALCGYIIPGHMANKEFKKLHRKEERSV